MDLVLRTHLTKKLHFVLLKGVFGETEKKNCNNFFPEEEPNIGFRIS